MIVNKNRNRTKELIRLLPKINRKLKNLLNHKNPKVRIFAGIALFEIGNRHIARTVLEEINKLRA